MKTIYLSMISLLIITFSVQAQEKRINLYGGYVFDDNIDSYYDYDEYVNANVKGGLQYGGSIEFINPSQLGVELLYIGQNTTVPISYNVGFQNGSRNATNDLNLNYALIGINKYSKSSNSKLEGYGGLMLGCLFSSVKNTGISDSSASVYEGASSSGTRFTWGLKLGGNMWVSEKVAIKLQGQFLSTTEAVGGTSYYGSYYGYYTYLNMFQWSFSTGLVFKLGSK
jgi:hypothetical protein